MKKKTISKPKKVVKKVVVKKPDVLSTLIKINDNLSSISGILREIAYVKTEMYRMQRSQDYRGSRF